MGGVADSGVSFQKRNLYVSLLHGEKARSLLCSRGGAAYGLRETFLRRAGQGKQSLSCRWKGVQPATLRIFRTEILCRLEGELQREEEAGFGSGSWGTCGPEPALLGLASL